MLKSENRFIVVIGLFCALLFWGLRILDHGPSPLGANAPLDQFSAARAYTQLEDLIGDNTPHPNGSDRNKKLRQTIENKFKSLGYTPEIQTGLSCTPGQRNGQFAGCTAIENIIVRHKGNGNTQDTIMLTAHYDGVPAGPAAADDSSGVAALLEYARILKQGPAYKNNIAFVITDGEEGGLRGAVLFQREHPLFKHIKLVINVEARGSSGPSNMFETHSGNLELIQIFAKHNRKAVANSISYEIYKRLSNDTDYSVYRQQGVLGLNYAFSHDVARYHSAFDTVENLSPNSIQHHGDNVMAAMQGFGNYDLTALQKGAHENNADATYFNVFNWFVAHWPSSWNIPLSILAIIIFIATARANKFSLKTIISSIAIILTLAILIVLLGFLVSFPLGKWADVYYLDHPYPWIGRTIYVMLGFCAIRMAARLTKRFGFLSRNFNPTCLTWGAGLIFALLSLASALLLSGASYLFLLAALAIAIGGALDHWAFKSKTKIALWLGIAIMGYMGIYHLIALELIMPYGQSHLRITPVILFAMALLPLYFDATQAAYKSKTRSAGNFAWGFGALCTALLGLCAYSLLTPGFNKMHPRAQNIVYLQHHNAAPDVPQAINAHWITETFSKPDAAFAMATKINEPFKKTDAYYAIIGQILAKKTTPISPAFAPAKYSLIDNTVTGDKRTILMDITSSHGGFGMGIGFAGKYFPLQVYINDKLAADLEMKGYVRPITVLGQGKQTYRATIIANAQDPLDMVLIDVFNLSPKQLNGMAEFRKPNTAPMQFGDRAIIIDHIRFDCEAYCNSRK